jgi:hypothetical protein
MTTHSDEHDYTILKDYLYLAIHVPEGMKPPR